MQQKKFALQFPLSKQRRPHGICRRAGVHAAYVLIRPPKMRENATTSPDGFVSQPIFGENTTRLAPRPAFLRRARPFSRHSAPVLNMLNKRMRHCSEALPRPRSAGRRTPADGDAWISHAQRTRRRIEGRTIIPRLSSPVAAPGLSPALFPAFS